VSAQCGSVHAQTVNIATGFLEGNIPITLPWRVPFIYLLRQQLPSQAHLLATNDLYFVKVGLPVDVFHFKTKHKLTDVVCQIYCNPACFQELVGDVDQKNHWIFNSSAAEQANVWFGKFANNVREMLPARYGDLVLSNTPINSTSSGLTFTSMK
jgi:hypothetical protein